MHRLRARTRLGGGKAVLVFAIVALVRTARAEDPTAAPVVRSILTVDEPLAGHVTTATEVRVAGRVSDGAIRAVRVNGVTVAVADGKFEALVALPVEGSNKIAVQAVAGNHVAVHVLDVIVDRTFPVFAVEPSGRVGVFDGAAGRIHGFVLDAHLRTLRANGVVVATHPIARQGPPTVAEFDSEFVLPAIGDLTVVLDAVDLAGNRTLVAKVLRRRREGEALPSSAPPSEEPMPETDDVRRERVTATVEAALAWLAAHQLPDGGWSAANFGRWCDGEERDTKVKSDGAGKPQYDIGVTGLATLAFLGAGYSNRSEGPYGRVVGNALKYLRNTQDAEGCFGPRYSGHFPYSHAIATLAMVEAFRAKGSVIYRKPATQGLHFVELSRNPDAGWRYGVQPGDSDTMVTSWMLHALLAAQRTNRDFEATGRVAPFELDPATIRGAADFIDRMTEAATGRVGYTTQGSGSARPAELVDKFPSEKTEATTAVGLYARLRVPMGPLPDVLDDPAVMKGLALLAPLKPGWDISDGSIDAYYWYYGTLATHAAGGAAWASWRKALERTLVGSQRTDGTACAAKGSWDAVDPWGPDGGRVYMTAIAAMALEVERREEPSITR